jgi:NAD(P)-dependent dehydrogenase (short-subunit alcohol dehydrogenase family)
MANAHRYALEGKSVVVTGAGSGIGRAVALRFAEEGSRVMIADQNGPGAEETARLIRDAGGEARFRKTDVAAASDVDSLVRETLSAFGRLDAAINNAGVAGRYTNVVDCSEEEWDWVAAVNLKAVWLCMRAEVPAMMQTGGGAIVNIASVAALRPPPSMATYSATKAGLVGLTRSAALDFAKHRVRVNALLPGVTITPLLRSEKADAYAASIPLGRVGAVEDQAEAAAWLCSDYASFVTGISLPVDGGSSLT